MVKITTLVAMFLSGHAVAGWGQNASNTGDEKQYKDKMVTFDVNINQKNTIKSDIEENITSLASTDEPRVFETNLDDYRDIQIYTEIYIGEKMEPYTMIFDSGSQTLWVASIECWNCPIGWTTPEEIIVNNKYDITKNPTVVKQEKNKLLYGVGTVEGYMIEDKVCATKDACIPSFPFLLVEEQSRLENIKTSGLVGLGPKGLFISELKEQGAIDHKIFSMSLAPLQIQSKMTFGGHDVDQYATAPLNWHKVSGDKQHWSVYMREMRFAHNEDWTQTTNGSGMFSHQNIIIDSGTSFNLIPKPDLKQFLEVLELQTGMNCRDDDGVLRSQLKNIPKCQCTQTQYDSIPDLEYILDNESYVIDKQGFVQFNTDEFGNEQCAFMIMTAEQNMYSSWILGVNFMQNYYTVFDQENFQVGLAPSIHSVTERRWWFHFNRWSRIAAIIAGFAFLGALWECYERRRNGEIEEEEKQIEQAMLETNQNEYTPGDNESPGVTASGPNGQEEL